MNRAFWVLIMFSVISIAAIPIIGSSTYLIKEDENGIPIVDYGWLMGRKIGERRYPVTIAASADA